MLSAVSILFLVIALAITALAIRGRRLAPDPRCRRCNYNLAGLDAPARCPECGRPLTHRRAIRRGARRVRRVWLCFGITLAILGTSALVFDTRVDWSNSKPSWLILAEARWLPETEAKKSLSLLHARLCLGRLPASVVRGAVRTTLSRQADERSWNPLWGMILESARSKSMVNDEQWKRYLQNGEQYALHLTQREGSILIDIEPDYRFGGIESAAIRIVGVVLRTPEGTRQAQPAWHTVDGPVRVLPKVDPGLVTVEVQFETDLIRGYSFNESRTSKQWSGQLGEERITGGRHELTGTIDIAGQ